MTQTCLQTYRLTPAIGAIVEGVDLTTPLGEALIADIQNALDDHLVLFFEGQSLTPVQQRKFAAQFRRPLYSPILPRTRAVARNHGSGPRRDAPAQ